MRKRRVIFASSGDVDQLIDPDTIPGRVLHLEPSGLATVLSRGTLQFVDWTCSTSFATVFDNDQPAPPQVDGITLNSYQGCRFNASTKQHIAAACDSSNNPHLSIASMDTGSVASADSHGGLFTVLMVARRDVLDVTQTQTIGERRAILTWGEQREFTIDKGSFTDATDGNQLNRGIGLHARWDTTDSKLYFQSGFRYDTSIPGNQQMIPASAGGGGNFDSVGYLTTPGNVLVFQRAAKSDDGGNTWLPIVTVGTAMVTAQGNVNRGAAWAVDEWDAIELGSGSGAVDLASSHGGTTGLNMYIGGNGGYIASEQATNQTDGSDTLGSGLDIFEVVMYHSDGNSDSGRVVEYSDGVPGGIRVRAAGLMTPEYDSFADPSRSITSVANWLRDKYGIDQS